MRRGTDARGSWISSRIRLLPSLERPGDFFPLGRCKLVLTAESKDINRVFSPPPPGGAARSFRTGPSKPRPSW
jgi:hypothetical protein